MILLHKVLERELKELRWKEDRCKNTDRKADRNVLTIFATNLSKHTLMRALLIAEEVWKDFNNHKSFQPPEGEFVPPEGFNEPIPQGEIQPSITTTTEPAPSETTTTTSGTEPTATNAGTTGAVVNDFYRYYFG